MDKTNSKRVPQLRDMTKDDERVLDSYLYSDLDLYSTLQLGVAAFAHVTNALSAASPGEEGSPRRLIEALLEDVVPRLTKHVGRMSDNDHLTRDAFDSARGIGEELPEEPLPMPGGVPDLMGALIGVLSGGPTASPFGAKPTGIAAAVEAMDRMRASDDLKDVCICGEDSCHAPIKVPIDVKWALSHTADEIIAEVRRRMAENDGSGCRAN